MAVALPEDIVTESDPLTTLLLIVTLPSLSQLGPPVESLAGVTEPAVGTPTSVR